MMPRPSAPTTAKFSGRSRAKDFLRCRGVVVLWIGAVLVFALHFMPRLCVAMMDTETVVLPLFYQDVVTLHHPASDWQWGGFSGLFPDVTVFFLLNFLSGSGWFALEGTMVFFFLAWIGASAGLAAALRRPHPLALTGMFSLLVMLEACDFFGSRGVGANIQDAFFQPIYHSGTGLFFLVGTALFFAQISGGARTGYGGLIGLVFLAAISDALFLVVFVAPILATIAVLAAVFPGNGQRLARLAFGVGAAGGAGFLAAPFCFPVPLATGPYLVLNLAGARDSLAELGRQMWTPGHHFFLALIGLDVLAVLGGAAGLFFLFFSAAGKRMPLPLAAGMILGAAAIACDWGAVIVTDNYQGMQENRYLVVALALPLFALVLGLHALIPWRPRLENLFIIAVAGMLAGCAFLPLKPSDEYIEVEATLPFLRQVMKENGITQGLVSYWRANLYAFLSSGTVPLRAVTNDGSILHSFNTLDWYGRGRPVQDGPHFRLVLAPEEDERGAFGRPDQILHTPLGETVWLFSEARSIRYNDRFSLLLSNCFTDDGRTLRFDAAQLSSATGKIEGTSRIAVEGRDSENFLTYGPYLELKPGRFRAVYHYAYSAPPAPDREALYDRLEYSNEPDLDHTAKPLPCPNREEQILIDDFTVPRPGENFEFRIHYRGSGTLRVDSLEITPLEP